MSKPFVALYRVSTKSQADSGLSYEAQRDTCERYVRSVGGVIVREFRCQESGRTNERTIRQALGACRQLRASLVVARLDRLSRRAGVLIAIRDSGVPVVVADQPHLDGTFWAMQSVWAEHEARLISERTRAALKAAQRRGVVLGGPPLTEKARRLGRQRRSEIADERASAALPAIRLAKRNGAATLDEIAAALNANGISTPSQRGSWNASMIWRVERRLDA